MQAKTIPSYIPSYGILLLVVLSAVLIAWVPGKSLLFLVFLLLNIALCILNRKFFTHSSLVAFRTLVGLVFVFSSLSKGVDPTGTAYMIEDYLEAYRLPWLSFLAVPGSFLLNLVEFCIGIFLLFNVHFKLTVWVLALMMAFFTGVTWYDAVANPVPDCGCFGKALVISNWQTFYKNLALDAATLALFFSRNRIRTRRSLLQVRLVTILAAVLFLGFECFNYRYLPVVNFLEWKKGERLFPENPLPVRHYMTYRDKRTGQTQEYLLEECPFDDPQWVENWEFVSRRDVDPNEKMVNINILDKVDDEDPGLDITKPLLQEDRYLFLVAVYDLDALDGKGMEKVAAFVKKMRQAGYSSCFLTASTVARAKQFQKMYAMEDIPVYFADDTSVKAVIRSNPGVVLVRDSRVLGLWDWRRLPAPEEVDFAGFGQTYGFDR